jgi:hypothetical protein
MISTAVGLDTGVVFGKAKAELPPVVIASEAKQSSAP